MADWPRPADASGKNPPPPFGDDLLDADGAFDPGQWAIHALLSTFFDTSGEDRTQQVQAIIDRIARKRTRMEPPAGRLLSREPSGRRIARAVFVRLRSRLWALAGLATTASVVIALLVVSFHSKSGRALAMDLREIGYAPPLVLASVWEGTAGESTLRKAEESVEQARTDLEDALSAGDPEAHDPWIPWTTLYRNLKTLGRWDEAIVEAQAFVEYAEKRDALPLRFSMYYSGLSDLGNLYMAIGDYESALTYHSRSLEVARDYQHWFYASGLSFDPRPHELQSALAVSLPPRLWTLSMLVVAEDNQSAAWAYHDQAGELLTDFFRKECEYRGLRADPHASLVQLCRLVVADGDTGLESPVIKVREHLLYQTQVLRIARDLDAAEATLALAATLRDYPFADESRLDFNEPMERLRIAVARGHFEAALIAADEAQQHTRPRHFPDHPDHPPIGVLARAELQFLRGVARAGINPHDPNALSLIESAADVVKESAAFLPEAQRKRLLQRFADWDHVANRILRGVFPER